MPNLHDAGVLKKTRRILAESGGPKLSSRLINGFKMSVTTLELCYELLETMPGHKCRLWRDVSGPSFKQPLRERVERVLSGQMQQPLGQQEDSQNHQSGQTEQVGQAEQAENVEEIDPKAAVLQKAHRSININHSVRINGPSGEASLIDAIEMLCPGINSNNAGFLCSSCN